MTPLEDQTHHLRSPLESENTSLRARVEELEGALQLCDKCLDDEFSDWKERAEKAEAERDQAVQGECDRAVERDEARSALASERRAHAKTRDALSAAEFGFEALAEAAFAPGVSWGQLQKMARNSAARARAARAFLITEGEPLTTKERAGDCQTFAKVASGELTPEQGADVLMAAEPRRYSIEEVLFAVTRAEPYIWGDYCQHCGTSEKDTISTFVQRLRRALEEGSR